METISSGNNLCSEGISENTGHADAGCIASGIGVSNRIADISTRTTDCESEGDVIDPSAGYKGKSKIRNIQIKGLDYGFTVQIGCQNFAVETPEKVCSKLLEYMKNPNSIERDWFNGKFLNDDEENKE